MIEAVVNYRGQWKNDYEVFHIHGFVDLDISHIIDACDKCLFTPLWTNAGSKVPIQNWDRVPHTNTRYDPHTKRRYSPSKEYWSKPFYLYVPREEGAVLILMLHVAQEEANALRRQLRDRYPLLRMGTVKKIKGVCI